jgi:hypothetical protein
MHSVIRITFPHRHNEDGSYDSICTACFVTVGTDFDEANLRRIEAAHLCNPLQLQWVGGAGARPSSSRSSTSAR